jgi:sugar/nucleoside kinase (ribokinase family)
MTKINYDIALIGNAIVDIIAQTSDSMLKELLIEKGAMQIIDAEKADDLLKIIDNPIIVSGGSAANTAVGFSSFGGIACFLGQTGSDEFGTLFEKNINEAGVFFQRKQNNNLFEKTSKSIILVSPDAERSMSTFLGASIDFNINCVNEELIINSNILYIEGYLFDQPEAKKAIYHCCRIAKEKNIQIALSLSDLFCVERHRKDFLSLISEFIHIVFANEAELKSLYQMDFSSCINKLKEVVTIGAITLGSKGSLIFKNGLEYNINANKIENLVDTTGAGDLFAAGFLYGFSKSLSIDNCGSLGTKAASEIITYYGARPKILLKNLLS